MERGAAACSDADILAIIIGSGCAHWSAEQMAQELLERFGSLGGIMGQPLAELAKLRGIKAVRAVRIAAAYELARRVIQHLEREQV